MEKNKITEDIQRAISRGQYNGQDDKLKDVITNEGVCRNIFAGDDSFEAVSEFTVDMLAFLLGYLAITSGEFEDENEYKHTVSKYAALFDMDSDPYFNEEKKEFDIERLVYDIATKVYEGYWNYDEISKHPEELEIFTEAYNNDLQSLLKTTGDKNIAIQVLNPKTLLFYSSKLMAKKPENEEEEMKMVAKLETVNDLSVILAKGIGMFDEKDKDELFLETIKDEEINNIMDGDTILKLAKALMAIYKGRLDSEDEKDGPLPIFTLMGQDDMRFPLTFIPKVIEDFKFLVSVMTLKLFKDKKKFNNDTFNSIFRPKDKELAEKVLGSLIVGQNYKEELIDDSDIYTESGDFDLYEALRKLTSTRCHCSVFLRRYKYNEAFKEVAEVYDNLECLYTENEKDEAIFHGFESDLLFNLLYNAFAALLAISEDKEIYDNFLEKVREILHENIGEEKRNVSILAKAYNIAAADDFFDVCTLAQKIDELSDRAVDDCEIDELPDNVVKFDRSKLS